MIEPVWGVQLLQALNDFVSQSATRFHIAAILADYPIFLVPLFLLALYISYGIVKKNRNAKYAALLIVGVAVVAVAINLGIQHFIDKARPETALLNAGHLVMTHLPTRSFPSDHAAVSMAIALAALRCAYRILKKKTVIIRGRILLVGSIVMSVARVAVGVHWPTDIIVGWLIGLVATCIVFIPAVQRFLERYILRYVVRVEEYISKRPSR